MVAERPDGHNPTETKARLPEVPISQRPLPVIRKPISIEGGSPVDPKDIPHTGKNRT